MYRQLCVDIFLETQCPTPENVSNSNRLVQGTAFLDTVVYTCTPGLRFYDGTTTKTVHCNASGLWSETTLDCKGCYITFLNLIQILF